MADVFFKNTKTGKRYKVVGLDPEKGEITLQGEYATFTEKYDKAVFKRMGYVVEQGPTPEE